MKKILITGGSGFYCTNIDLQKDEELHENLLSIQGDIRNSPTLDQIFSKYKFDTIFHCAAILAHDAKDKNFLWTSKIDETKNTENKKLEGEKWLL